MNGCSAHPNTGRSHMIKQVLNAPVRGAKAVGNALSKTKSKIAQKTNNAVVGAYSMLLPPLSDSEREALNAGTVGFEGGIFAGKPDWKNLMDLPAPVVSKEAQAFLDGPVNELCRMLDNWAIANSGNGNDDLGDLPAEVWAHMMEHGYFGLETAKEDGGKGFTAFEHRAIVEKISSKNVIAAVTIMVPNSLGPAELIHQYGTDEQKSKFLSKLASGELLPCFGLTGVANGSDAAGSMQDEAVVIKDKETGKLSLKMNFSKRYITLGPVTDLAGVTVKVRDPDGLLGDKVDLGITAVLVPKDAPGFETGTRHYPSSLAFMNGPLVGKDVILPIEDNVIGGYDGLGKGWKMVMECLGVGRCISLPAQSTAGSKLAIGAAGAYAGIRQQFNTSISNFGGIEEVLARMASRTYSMDATGKATALMVDRGERPMVLSGISKYHLTEGLRQNVNDGMDVLAGAGVQNGPRNILFEGYKGIPVAITVEGANIMTRNLQHFGIGLVMSHPYLKKHMEAAANNDGWGIVKNVVKHATNSVWNFIKSGVMGITDGRFSRVPVKNKKMKRYYQKLNRMSSNFNVMTNMALLTYGGKLKFEERVSARLGDIESHIAMASMALWKFEKDGSPKEDLPLVERAVKEHLHLGEKALKDAQENFAGGPIVRGLLRMVTTPLAAMPFSGRYRNKIASDKLDHKVAKTVTVPGPSRDRLINNIYWTNDVSEPTGLLEAAFNKSAKIKPIEDRLKKAAKQGVMTKEDASNDNGIEIALRKRIITKNQAAAIREARDLRWKAYQVDEFAQKDPQKNIKAARKSLQGQKAK